MYIMSDEHQKQNEAAHKSSRVDYIYIYKYIYIYIYIKGVGIVNIEFYNNACMHAYQFG